ncbi:MAG: GNAT family N-acetyltransferase [Pseudomonadota bacterium]
MLIRAATPDDAARVSEMTAEVSDHEGSPQPSFDTEVFLNFGFGADRAFECFVAEVSESVVGHVSITWGFDVQDGCKSVWVADLFVDAKHRKKGIGRALMAHVCRQALSHDAGHVQFMVAPTNLEAAEFYAAIGSKRDRGIPMFLPPTAIGTIAEQGL